MPRAYPTVAQVLQLPSLTIRTVPPGWQDLNGHVNVRHYLELYDEASRPLLPVLGLVGLAGDGGQLFQPLPAVVGGRGKIDGRVQ